MKTKINFFQLVALILLSISLFSSCSSNELKNDEATALISKLPNEIVKGKIRVTLSSRNYNREWAIRGIDSRLIQMGILTDMQIYEVHKPGEPLIYQATSEFTAQAKALLLGSDYSSYIVKCGELKFVDVVGVFQENNSKTAEIEYKVSFIPTMFADIATMQPKYENGMTYSKKLTAKKYDNGWRIEN